MRSDGGGLGSGRLGRNWLLVLCWLLFQLLLELLLLGGARLERRLLFLLNLGAGAWTRLLWSYSRGLGYRLPLLKILGRIWPGRVNNWNRGVLGFQVNNRLGRWSRWWSCCVGWRGHVPLQRIRLGSWLWERRADGGMHLGVGIASLHKGRIKKVNPDNIYSDESKLS